MQEQQGNLEEPLSGLPGPRPFNKKTKKDNAMENKKVDDIVARAAEAISSGKSFGGWTDPIEEGIFQKHVKKQHDSMKRNKKEDEIPLVIHGPDGTRKNPQYSKFIYPKDVLKKEKNESVELIERVVKQGKSIPMKLGAGRAAGNAAPRQLKDKKKEAMVVKQGKSIPMKLGAGRAAGNAAPRQLKDKKKEAMVVKDGKVKVIDREHLDAHISDGWGLAEGVGSMLGGAIGSIVPGVGTAIGAAVGGAGEALVKGAFKKKKAAGEPGKE